MARSRPREIFLSHSHRDQAAVQRLITFLEQHKLRVWCAPDAIRGAELWHDKIGEALRRCDWFIVFLTPNAVRSRWVKRELLDALNRRRLAERIVPILAKTCDFQRLSWTLNSLQLIDMRKNTEAARAKLLATWNIKPLE